MRRLEDVVVVLFVELVVESWWCGRCWRLLGSEGGGGNGLVVAIEVYFYLLYKLCLLKKYLGVRRRKRLRVCNCNEDGRR